MAKMAVMTPKSSEDVVLLLVLELMVPILTAPVALAVVLRQALLVTML